ncbi:MAG: selenocysteine lyase/cysteine desulfurase [Planctomycetota bacterium]|jgi:selenocysteine lyase/cysteine desulfurase
MPTTQELIHPGRELFAPMPAGRTFVNAAYMSPLPLLATEAMQNCITRMACPDFGVEDFFGPGDRVRELLAQVVGGPKERFSLTGSASQGTATIAWNLRLQADELVGKRRRILGVQGQFPSNVQTWMELAAHGFSFEMVEGGPGASERLIEQIDEHTALVATEPLSWTDGRRLDLRAVLGAAKQAGALSLLDVTQSAGADSAMPDDMHCDIVLAGGYKWLLGPYGTGFMRLTRELQEKLEPLDWNWKNFDGSSDFNSLGEYRRDFASLAAKFDHGESSAFLRLAGWEAALKTLIQLTPEAISAHGRAFADALCAALPMDKVSFSDFGGGLQAPHLFRITPRDASQFDALSESLAAAGVEISRRDGGWRISPHVYNHGADLERFVEVLS